MNCSFCRVGAQGGLPELEGQILESNEQFFGVDNPGPMMPFIDED